MEDTQRSEPPLGGRACSQQEPRLQPGLAFIHKFVCVCVYLNASAYVFVQDPLSNPTHLDPVAVKHHLTRDVSQTYLHPD